MTATTKKMDDMPTVRPLRAEVEPAEVYKAVCAMPAPTAAEKMLMTRGRWGDDLTPIARFAPIHTVIDYLAAAPIGSSETLRVAAEDLRRTPAEIASWLKSVREVYEKGVTAAAGAASPLPPPGKRKRQIAAEAAAEAAGGEEDAAPNDEPLFLKIDWSYTTLFFGAKRAKLATAYRAIASHTTLKEAMAMLPALIEELTKRTLERKGNVLAVHTDAATNTARLEPWFHAACRQWARTGQQLHLLAATQSAAPTADPDALVENQYGFPATFEVRPGWEACCLQYWSYVKQLEFARAEFVRVMATARSAMPSCVGDAMPQATIALERWLAAVTVSADPIYELQYSPQTPSGMAFKAFSAGKMAATPLRITGEPWCRGSAPLQNAPIAKQPEGVDDVLKLMRKMNDGAPTTPKQNASQKPHSPKPAPMLPMKRGGGSLAGYGGYGNATGGTPPAKQTTKQTDACSVCTQPFTRTSPAQRRCRDCCKANRRST